MSKNINIVKCIRESLHERAGKTLQSVSYFLNIGDIAYAESILSKVADNGNEAIVRFLVMNGIKEDIDWALCLAAENGNMNILTFLVENGADIHTTEDLPLRYAVRNGHEAVVRYLVENGANIHAKESEVIRYARLYGADKIVDFLKQHARLHEIK